jgi:hypothetical protein
MDQFAHRESRALEQALATGGYVESIDFTIWITSQFKVENNPFGAITRMARDLTR